MPTIYDEFLRFDAEAFAKLIGPKIQARLNQHHHGYDLCHVSGERFAFIRKNEKSGDLFTAYILVDADDVEGRFTPQEKNPMHRHIHFSPPDVKTLKYVIQVLKSAMNQ
jgi:hypothetical protein